MIRTMLGLSLAVLLAGAATADTYSLTGGNTKVEFVGSKAEGKHDGGFKNLTGTATADAGNVRIEVEIDTTSLYSDNQKLTGHLKSPDFFDVKNNPKAKFVTTKVEKGANGTYTVTGDLTLLGKTKTISFPAQIQTGDTFTLKSEFKINRTDFGMSWGKGKVHDDVTVKVNVAAKK